MHVQCEKEINKDVDGASAQSVPFGDWKAHTDLGGYLRETAPLSLKTAVYCAKKKKEEKKNMILFLQVMQEHTALSFLSQSFGSG